MIPNCLRQVVITEQTHFAIARVIFLVLKLEGRKTVDDVVTAWEGVVGPAEAYNWGDFADAFGDSTMLKTELQPSLGGLPIGYTKLFKALSVINPWTPISEDGYFGIVEAGDGFKVLEAGKTCPFGRHAILMASDIPTTRRAWTTGKDVPLSEEGDGSWGADPVPYDMSVLTGEGFVVDQRFQTAMSQHGVILEWLLNAVFLAAEARTNCRTPNEALQFVSHPPYLSQNEPERLVLLAKQAMTRGQMYHVGVDLRSTVQPELEPPVFSGSRTGQLTKLFLHLFTPAELKRFLIEIDSDIQYAFSFEGALFSVASDAVEALDRRGLVTAKFFDRMATERPSQVLSIRQVQGAWGL